MVATYSAVVELVDESVNLSDFTADACFVVVKCVKFCLRSQQLDRLFAVFPFDLWIGKSHRPPL